MDFSFSTISTEISKKNAVLIKLGEQQIFVDSPTKDDNAVYLSTEAFIDNNNFCGFLAGTLRILPLETTEKKTAFWITDGISTIFVKAAQAILTENAQKFLKAFPPAAMVETGTEQPSYHQILKPENVFDDSELRKLIKSPASNNKLEILLPDSFGFCGGVRAAVKILDDALNLQPQKKFHLLGEIIHNHTANHYFCRRGVIFHKLEDLENLLANICEEDVFVIPAFGLPLNHDKLLRQNLPANKILDTTCRYVKRVWKFAQERAAEHALIVIHGKPGHPETNAILSRVRGHGNAVAIVRDHQETKILIESLQQNCKPELPKNQLLDWEKLNLKRIACVSQTTMLHNETMGIRQELQLVANKINAEFSFPDTICLATQQRQEAAKNICQKNSDLILVVGGIRSSNTTQLHKLASNYAPTFFIRDAWDFDAEHIEHFIPEKNNFRITKNWLPENAKVCLLSGASCPPLVIIQTMRHLKFIKN